MLKDVSALVRGQYACAMDAEGDEGVSLLLSVLWPREKLALLVLSLLLFTPSGAAASERRRCFQHGTRHCYVVGEGPALSGLVQHRRRHPGLSQSYGAKVRARACSLLAKEPGIIKHWAASPPCIYFGEFEACPSMEPAYSLVCSTGSLQSHPCSPLCTGRSIIEDKANGVYPCFMRRHGRQDPIA